MEQKQKQDSAELQRARDELQAWRAKVEQAELEKSRLIKRNLEEDELKKEAMNQMKDLTRRRQEAEQERKERSQELRAQTTRVVQKRTDLMERLKRSRAELEQRRAEALRLQHRFKICADLPDKEVEFIKPKPGVDDVTSEAPIRGQFSVYQQGALLLKEGQALITFEEERVLSQVLQMDRCSVSFDDHTLEVKPKRFRTEPTVQFEIHLAVSRCDLDVSEVVSAMPNERVEDCLALSFSRPSRGGAEVQSVKFNPRKSTARIHFQRTGVAESLALKGEFSADLGFQTKVKVSPVFDVQLHKFQSSCGVPKRTLLLDGIKDTGDEEEVQDQLEIHFQKPSNGGGEIEHTKYCGPGRSVLALLCPDH